MYTDIKTFEDACNALKLDASKVIPDFSFFPEEDKKAMIAHSKLIIVVKALCGDWVPDWENGKWDKYNAWFIMGSPSGVGFAYDDCDYWNAGSSVGSHLCFPSSEIAEYAGKQFEELFKDYFVKQ